MSDPQRRVAIACSEAAEKLHRGRFAEAEAAYEGILADRPRHVESLLGLGRALRGQGRLERALSCGHNAMATAPDRADVFAFTADVLSDMGRHDAALGCLTHALDLAPDDPNNRLAMGRALETAGHLAAALDHYSQALEAADGKTHREARLRALNRMGAALARMGDPKGALARFDRVLAEDPENPSARHLAAALRKETPEDAPPAYVQSLFDAFSGDFDRIMTEELAYQTPGRLRDLLIRQVPERDGPFQNAVDLGCGTGLSGKAFRDRAKRLTGVDLSPRMVEKARAKGIYDRLAVEDILGFLEKETIRYDLFVAADVLVYTGDLAPIFRACRKQAAKGAKMAFSTERCHGTDYRLRTTGRFAHNETYVRETAETSGWREIAGTPSGLRKDDGAWIQGYLFVMETIGPAG